MGRLKGAYKRAKKKSRYQKKGNKRNVVNTTIIRGPSAITDQAMVKLHYQSLDSLVMSSGAINNNFYRGNSIFDPDEALGGGQPMGFDQWAAFYNRYQVNGCKVEIEVLPNPAISPPAHGILAVVPLDSVSAISGILQACELPYAKSKIVPSTAVVPIKITNYISTAAKFGYPAGITQEDDLSSGVAANPSEQWYYGIVGGVMDGTSNVTLQYKIKLTYYVRFFDRRDLGRS